MVANLTLPDENDRHVVAAAIKSNADVNVTNNLNLSNLFNLYQDRVKHGGSSISRYDSDIEKLLTAKISKRNYYFLAQSYMCKQDFENGFKYNLLSFETNDITSSNIDAVLIVEASPNPLPVNNSPVSASMNLTCKPNRVVWVVLAVPFILTTSSSDTEKS